MENLVSVIMLATVYGEPMALVEFEGTQMLVPPCQYEDSDNCYWDAATRGNGRGMSFYSIDGIVTYYHWSE